MFESHSVRWYSHWGVRLVAVLNLTALALLVFSPWYEAVVGPVISIIVFWFIASSLLLPSYVVIEFFWMTRTTSGEVKANVIDAAFAGLWFLTWWAVSLHILTSSVPF